MKTSPSRYILAIDVGNTQVKAGLFERAAGEASRIGLPVCHRPAVFRFHPPVGLPELETLFDTVKNEPPEGAEVTLAISGSNPAGVQIVLDMWPGEGLPEPVVIANGTQLPLEIDVEFPERVGIDRLLNAVSANAIRLLQQPAVIVSTGTASTVDYVSARGAFQGGAILPGFELSAKALHDYTALLPLINTQELGEVPPVPIGRNTQQAIQSGIYWGHVGAVKELVARLVDAGGASQTDLSAAEAPLILLTGGAAPMLRDHLPPSTQYEPHLVLQGMVLSLRH
jgi:type III pantothenate kinase